MRGVGAPACPACRCVEARGAFIAGAHCGLLSAQPLGASIWGTSTEGWQYALSADAKGSASSPAWICESKASSFNLIGLFHQLLYGHLRPPGSFFKPLTSDVRLGL